MTEFERELAKALADRMSRIRSDEFKLPWDADLPLVPLAARLAPHVAAAIDAARQHAQISKPGDAGPVFPTARAAEDYAILRALRGES